ncbi:MAG: hypothetical protein PW843_19985 [Azospirillaceae bacterium]|nr:hypothetical protein [Azospirillaceae bacterium]
MFKPASMTRWYHPPRLLGIALRALVSGLFGEFADRREAMAASRRISPTALDPTYRYQVADGESFWFDFMADTGDGWNSTYAIARLLADPDLRPAPLSGAPVPEPLPIGRLLVMGGDQVYPTASRDDYRRKLIEPLEAAAKAVPGALSPTTHDLYAIPGNHDWYDGLTSFLGVFCARRLPGAFNQPHKGRDIGGRRTQQTRSYFALELPHGWWLWGIDIQLSGYVDQPQVDFFDHVARKWMPQGSKLIICTGQPEWAYVGADPEHWKTFRNFSYLESLATLAGRDHQVRLVLSGDSHHYARYSEGDRHYIVAGGGGAFLHPTHQLREKNIFNYAFPPPGVTATPGARYQRAFQLNKTFPSQAESRCIAWKNLFFALYNPDYWATLGGACALFAWLLNANAIAQGTDLVSALRGAGPGNWGAACWAYFKLVFASPWPSLLGLAAAGGYCAFAKPYGQFGGLVRGLAGFLHALVELIIVIIATILLAWYLPGGQWVPWMILAIGIVGGLLAATVMGIYLLISLNGFKLHWNEAFSSMRIEGYKNFLRLKIDPKGDLTVYPIGLVRTPADDGRTPRNPPLAPRLIEDPFKI